MLDKSTLSAAPVWQMDDEGTAEMAHCVVLLMCTTLEVVVAERMMRLRVARSPLWRRR